MQSEETVSGQKPCSSYRFKGKKGGEWKYGEELIADLVLGKKTMQNEELQKELLDWILTDNKNMFRDKRTDQLIYALASKRGNAAYAAKKGEILNKMIADLMHRLNLCEKRGLGWDTIIRLCEEYRLPPPDILVFPESTVITLYKFKKFSDLDRGEKMRACYQHACLMHAIGKKMTNASLRERFGLDDTQMSKVSRLIRDAVDAKVIKSVDTDAGSRFYIPEWA